MPEIVSSLLCKVQLLFLSEGVYTHYYSLLPLIATLVALVNILFVRSFVDTYNTKILLSVWTQVIHCASKCKI